MINSCILLLDGWTPLAPGVRAQLADVVLTAKILKRYVDFEDETINPIQSGRINANAISDMFNNNNGLVEDLHETSGIYSSL